MAHTQPLQLRIEFQDRLEEISLEIGRPFVIGRATDVDLSIKADSISTHHLELLWDGVHLRVRDLESSNGTFRMPQDSPFLEASFVPHPLDLDLRLAKLRLRIRASADASDEVFERTEVMHGGLPPLPTAPAEAEWVATKQDRTVRAQAKVDEPQTSKPAVEKPHRVSHWARPVFVVGVLVAVVQNLYFYSKHASFLNVDPRLWPLGPGVDLYIFWLKDLPVFAGIWVVALILIFVLRRRLPLMRAGVLSLLMLIGGLGFSVSVLFWPASFLGEGARQSELRTAVGTLQTIEAQFATHDFQSRVANLDVATRLGQLSLPLKGSSVFYAAWHNFQKKRVVGECGGLGDGEWEKKRVCLLLLYALSLDAYTSIRPVYLGPTAASLVFLTSLDGVIRVLAAEGPKSPSLTLFLDSLGTAGLSKESGEFKTLVESFRGADFADLMQALLEMRLKDEHQVSDAQTSRDIPREMSLNLMGPLEMGI